MWYVAFCIKNDAARKTSDFDDVDLDWYDAAEVDIYKGDMRVEPSQSITCCQVSLRDLILLNVRSGLSIAGNFVPKGLQVSYATQPAHLQPI